MRLHSESGATLLEVVAVVAIGLAATVGVFAISHHVVTNNQTQSAARLLSSVIAEVIAYKQTYGTFAQIDCGSGSDASCYLVDKKLVDTAKKNPFGADVAMTKVSDSEVKFSMSDVPKESCRDLMLALNQKFKVKRIELFNPDQQSITNVQYDQFGNMVCNANPPGHGNGQFESDPENNPCVGFNVQSVNIFPVPVNQAANMCTHFDKFRMVWTL